MQYVEGGGGGDVMNTRERGYTVIRGRHEYAEGGLHCNKGGGVWHEYAGEGMYTLYSNKVMKDISSIQWRKIR